ncbi:TolC family protein, partial [Hydrogenophaga sp.]|uniref:TolC family protein n=1 Tax=Hydrogenophaga sp. TaxID=1904254 RepID=UPI00356B1F46
MTRTIAIVAMAALLSACSVTRPPTQVAAAVPAAWYAPPLPHQGSSQNLAQWWARFDDPVLTDWIERAQIQSASIASARAQVFAARANRIAAASGAGPQAALVAGASRGRSTNLQAPATSLNAGAQMSWELDLWGAADASVGRAQAQQEAASAGWHEAR